jgi:hypothetical protein
MAFMGVASVFVALGLYYRRASVMLVMAFAFQFLLDQARYLNHYYAALLFLLLLAALPAHTCWSIDAWRNRKAPGDRVSGGRHLDSALSSRRYLL